MSPLGKRIIVFTMMWVLLVMVVSQVYDNVTGRGMPARRTEATPEVVSPDEDVQRLADLQSCVAANPDDLQCNLDLADLYYRARQWPQAQVNYERFVRLQPGNASVLLKLAGTYIYQGKFEQAIPTLQEAAAVQPDAPEIHLLLGLSLSKLDPPKNDEAVAAWRKVIELDPDSAWAMQASEYIGEVGP